jgi:type II secretory pathway component GspD/PulD (secretin)
MLRIVTALDTSIASVTSIKVFPLRFADAKALATVVQQLFAPQTTAFGGQGGRAQQFFNMMQRGGPGGGGGGPGGGGGGPGGATGGSTAGGAKVVASADEYSNSLIVSAAPETMATITTMVEQVDQAVDDLTVIRVFALENADPADLADQLSQLFPDESRTGSGNQRGGVRFFGGGPFGQVAGVQSNGTSQRNLKKSRVLAVADPRTSSLIVTASSELMPQIAEMVAKLDASPAKKENVAVFDLQNANPQDVYQILQDLFNRNNSMRANNNNRNSMLGQNNPLTQRATQQQSTGVNSSRFGSGTGRTGGNTGGF